MKKICIELSDTKICFTCEKELHISEFKETKVPHLLKNKENKGRCYSCNKCLERRENNV